MMQVISRQSVVSLQFGFLKLESPNEAGKKSLLNRAIISLEKKIKLYPDGECVGEKEQNVEPQIFCTLGHLNLLLENYPKALSAYQKYFALQKEHWKDCAFLYGLGITYFHFNSYQWATKAFQHLLYLYPDFPRSNEVHIRLGLMFKSTTEYDSSLKHFSLALKDSHPCSLSKHEIRFHIAHVLELQDKYKLARDAYEQLIECPDIPSVLKANALRQLGWMYHSVDSLGDGASREMSAVSYLRRSIEVEPTSGQSWYFLGRCLSSVGKVHDAFVSYRHSIDKSEASADTWCSIGVLYQQQNQHMDALQAYICAVQLDRSHSAAWTDLGILYESCSQPKDAFVCYTNAVNTSKSAEYIVKMNINESYSIIIGECLHKEAPNDFFGDYLFAPPNPNITSRIKLLQHHMNSIPAQHFQTKSKTLPSIEEAWSLPIPAELTSRQGANNQQNRTTSTTPAAINPQQQHSAQPGNQQQYLSGMNPASLLQQQQQFTNPPDDVPSSAKRRKTANSKNKTEPMDSLPTSYMTPQQLQTMSYLQQNQASLTPADQQLLQQLQQQFLMQQQMMNDSSARASVGSTMSVPGGALQFSNSSAGGLQTTLSHSGPTSSTPGGISNAVPQLAGRMGMPARVGSSNMQSEADFIDTFTREFGHTMSDQEINELLSPNHLATSLADDLLAQLSDPQQAKDVGLLLQINEKASAGGDMQLPWIKTENTSADSSAGFKSAESHGTEVQTKEEYTGLKSSLSPTGSGLSIALTAAQVVAYCKGPGKDDPINVGLLCEQGPPPVPPEKPIPLLAKDKLNPATPSIYLEKKNDAFSIELQQYCLSQSVCVIRGLAAALKLDLGFFSTKTLVEANPDHQVEIRTQRQQTPDENTDQAGNKVWKCESSRSYTNVAKYAQYQAASFQESLREEHEKSKGIFKEKESDSDSNSSTAKCRKKQSMIKFGTNVDLSDENKWKPQLQELSKLPAFTRVISASNMLSHIGHNILGVNTVQLYMKVPGSRTPGHQENNNFCAVNINIGPGDCEWFAVPEQYWGVMHQLCERNHINYLKGSWWPNLEDLYENDVPVYRFIQKPGDLVWLGPGTVHWVQAIGWCNNIAWNVGPLIWKQFQLSLSSYEYNKVESYKSIVPIMHLSWNLARNIRVTDLQLFELIKRTLLRTLKQCLLIVDLVQNLGRTLHYQAYLEGEAAPYCSSCEVEVFNILFVIELDKKHVVHCLNCARKTSPDLEGFNILNQYKIEELMEIYDNFQLGSIPQKNSDNWLSW